MAKHLISFLGTGNYIKCNYYLRSKKNKVDRCKFVQEAIVKIEGRWKKDDRITILLTDEAFKSNWVNSTSEKEGLKFALEKLNLKCKIETLKIPEGKKEEDLWHLFSAVVDNIEKRENVIFDITHGLRSQPILVMILLNYLKVLKKIDIKAIYYGAFEVLGKPKDVEEMPLEKRDAPIFDLTEFVVLYDWANAIDDFLKYGDATSIKKLTRSKIGKILAESKGKDKEAKDLDNFVSMLVDLSNNIRTNRSKEIIGFDGEGFLRLIENIKVGSDRFVKPLSQVLEMVREKVSEFKKNDIENGYRAVKWCIDHNLIQQGYTILQETIITDVLHNVFPEKDYYEEEWRNITSQALKISADKGLLEDESKWKDPAKSHRDEVCKIIDYINERKEIVNAFNAITDFRNDINHAGFNKGSRNFEKLRNSLERNFERILKVKGFD